jgi:hypothetical protein
MDQPALKRRVLLTGLIGLVGFFFIAWFVAWLEVADAWLLVGMALFYLLALRPLLRPVREAIRLRRRLAYHAYLEEREREG